MKRFCLKDKRRYSNGFWGKKRMCCLVHRFREGDQAVKCHFRGNASPGETLVNTYFQCNGVC